MNSGLREHKQASLRVAVPECLPEEMQPHVREIVSLFSEDRGKGQATTLLWSVCYEADQELMTLMVMPRKFSDGMDDDKLERFYNKFGFVELQRKPVPLMFRRPVIAKATLQ